MAVGDSYTLPFHIIGPGTFQVKVGLGTLVGISFNTNAAATVAVYDYNGTTGTPLLLGTYVTVGGFPPFSVELGYQFFTGLTIVPTGALDLTVCYQ